VESTHPQGVGNILQSDLGTCTYTLHKLAFTESKIINYNYSYRTKRKNNKNKGLFGFDSDRARFLIHDFPSRGPIFSLNYARRDFIPEFNSFHSISTNSN